MENVSSSSWRKRKRPCQYKNRLRGAKAVANETCKWRTIARLYLQLCKGYETKCARDTVRKFTSDECKRFVVDNESVDDTLVINIFNQLRKERYLLRYSIKLIGSIVWSNRRTVDRSLLHRLSGCRNRNVLEEMPRSEPSRNSDGILIFDKTEFRSLFVEIVRVLTQNLSTTTFCKLVDSSDTGSNALFMYVFYMLAVSGKRLSDIANLTIENLRSLRDDGVCVIITQKTRCFGCIEITEILRPDNFENDRKKRARGFVELFIRWCNLGIFSLPFDRTKKRRRLDAILTDLYERLFRRPRKRGLSFHALRRAYASYKFLQGCPLSIIQESLEHATRAMTNRYVNRCLFELTRFKAA